MENQLEMPKEEKRIFRFTRRHLVLACTVLLIAAALVLNIVLFNNPTKDPTPSAPTGDSSTGDDTSTDTSGLDGYFSATQVSRQRARDEALEVLQGVVESESADDATKTAALLEIADLAKAMEAEANIESLVLSKGFTQCVAVINGDACSVVVNGTELQQSQISQINEIVYEQAGIMPQDIRIIVK
ncbi:MAG: SpoIIIAH-like family protein [Clostridia bacterium]|nr:SpoIIIAH-like family protein [Clostridia bacterium]MBQ8338945.1 SpoIIIAH-like family protein [Clostridia bacterium]